MRNPLLMFGDRANCGVCHCRAPLSDRPRQPAQERTACYMTDLALLAILVVAWLTIGLRAYLLVQTADHGHRRRGRCLAVLRAAPVRGRATGSATTIGTTRWPALEGSSFYQLPRVLQWFSGNIGFHHIHHLDAAHPQLPIREVPP